MSLFSALGSATAGLRTVQDQLKVVSDNVARADDPNRTRHTVSQVVDKSGFVLTTNYGREVDSALRTQVQDLTAQDGTSANTSDYMQKLGDLLRTTNGNPLVNQYAQDFQAAWQTLQTTPESEVAQYQMVQAGDNFAREINRLSSGVEDLNREMKGDIDNSVSTINGLLSQLDQINDNIVSLQSSGDAAATVTDKRDGLLKELNSYIGVRTVERPDGRVAVFTQSGLALLDADAAKFTVDGGDINVVNGSQVTTITQNIKQGKLASLINMTKDGSATDPVTPASADPTSEVIRKLRSQLDTYAQMLTGKTQPGQPTSFSDAYDSAQPVADGELRTGFFTGKDRFTIGVNADLLNNTAKIKQSAIAGVVTAMTATGRSFNADGLQLKDTSYVNIASSITGIWTSAAKVAKDTAETNADNKSLLETRYQSTTGVNIDQEIANLQQLQTSYAASARVMQVANSMFDALEAVIR